MEYIHTLPEKTKKRQFIVSCMSATDPNTPERVLDCISELESKSSDRKTIRIMRKILIPVIQGLQCHQGVVDTMGKHHIYIQR